jgi:hypothetical protein
LQEANFNGFSNVFHYVRGLPMTSIQELLPIYDYLRDKDTGTIRQYPNNYPVNIFLEELNQPDKLAKLNQVRGLNIIGKMGSDSTIDTLRIGDEQFDDGRWENGYPENYDHLFGDHGLEYGEGDKTVPNQSNNTFNSFTTTVLNYDHRALVTEAQKIIIKELTGVEPTEMVRSNAIKKVLFIGVHSPVDFQVIAPDGKKVGKDFSNNTSTNEIPDAFYSGFENGPEFVFIPNPQDGDYQVVAVGTDSGTYDLNVSYFDEDNNQEQESWINDRPVVANQQDSFSFGLTVADGSLTDLHPDDEIPPVITISSPENKSYLHSTKVIISYQVFDADSGVKEQRALLDGTIYSASSIDLFYQPLGDHNFTVTAKDFAGNSSTSTVLFKNIATPDSLIADIERAYQLGLITNRVAKNTLLQLAKTGRELYNYLVEAKIKKPRLYSLAKTQLTNHLKLFKIQLDTYKRLGWLKPQGATIIYQQIEYIINNL